MSVANQGEIDMLRYRIAELEQRNRDLEERLMMETHDRADRYDMDRQRRAAQLGIAEDPADYFRRKYMVKPFTGAFDIDREEIEREKKAKAAADKKKKEAAQKAAQKRALFKQLKKIL